MNGGCSGNPNLVPSTNTQSSLTAVPGQSVFGLAVGRAGQVFYSVLGLPREVLIGGGTVATGTVACGTLNSGIASVSDNAGADAPICSGQRISFNGSAFGSSPIWSAGLLPPVLDAAGVVLARNGSGQTLAVALSSGTALAGAGALAWAIDASPTPVVYLSSGSTLSTQTLLPTGFTGTAAWGLPAVPGSVVTDMVMDKTGILYVASAGQVSAIITDSPGLGTANAAWPIAGHDACRSANLEYACPY